MSAPTFDLSGLPLLEVAVAKMQVAQAATPSIFSGQAPFTATYANVAGVNLSTETTTTMHMRLLALRAAFDTLTRG